MERTLIPLDLKTIKIRMKQNNPLADLESDLVETCKYVISLTQKQRKKDFSKAKKIMYLDAYEYHLEKNLLYLKFKSARYAKSRKVINTDTLVERGVLKKPVDGDEENTHIAIRFEDNNKAVCIFERNSDGIGVVQLFEYLNEFIMRYHMKINDSVYYALIHSNIISKEFLDALENVKRIRGVTLTVDQEDLTVSEAKAFSGRADLSKDVDIYVKPSAKGKSIAGDTVKDFYKMYKDANKKVKRITVKADNEDKNPITFDTEKIKAKKIVDVSATLSGEVKEYSIKEKLFEVIDEY